MNSFTVYLIMSFCSSLFFTVCFTVNLIYQATVVNLDPLQMVLVGTVLEITTFVLEVPTGVVAEADILKTNASPLHLKRLRVNCVYDNGLYR